MHCGLLCNDPDGFHLAIDWVPDLGTAAAELHQRMDG